MGRTGMAVIYGGALGRSLHGDRSRGSRQTGEQNSQTGPIEASPGKGDAGTPLRGRRSSGLERTVVA